MSTNYLGERRGTNACMKGMLFRYVYSLFNFSDIYGPRHSCLNQHWPRGWLDWAFAKSPIDPWRGSCCLTQFSVCIYMTWKIRIKKIQGDGWTEFKTMEVIGGASCMSFIVWSLCIDLLAIKRNANIMTISKNGWTSPQCLGHNQCHGIQFKTIFNWSFMCHQVVIDS